MSASSNKRYSTLAAAKVAAQAQVGVAYKGDRNNHAHYPYASKEEIAGVAKEAMAAVGLSFELRGPVGPPDGTWIPFVARFDHEGGEVEEWPVWWDSSELRMTSGAAKAGAVMSYAFKNALLNALCIPRETQETHNNRVDQQPDGKGQQRKPKRAPRKKESKPALESATPNRDELSKFLKGQLQIGSKDVDCVIALLSGGAHTGWKGVARDESACAAVIQAGRDFLTTLEPSELVDRAREGAQA